KPYNLFWLEEPLPSKGVGVYGKLTTAIDIPIAVGEHLQSSSEFYEFIKIGGAHVFQPDAGQLAGITEFLQIGNLVRDTGHALAPHFLPELHIHLAVAFSNSVYIEQFPWAHGLLKNPLEIVGGNAVVPDVVGHGVEFTAEARSK